MPGRTLRRPSDSRPSRSRNDEPRDEREDSEDDQPEEPRSRRSGSSRPSRRSAPSARRDEEDEKPRRGRGRSRDEDDDSVAGGWGAWRENKAKMSNFGEDFKVDYNRRYLIRILDDEPFAAFGQHWLDDMPKGERKSYVCLGEDCPLCDILSDKPRPLALFNVVEFVEEKKGRETVMTPKLKVWQTGPGIVQILEGYADDPQMSPLSDFYWQVSKSKSGKKGPTNYQITKVKDRDVQDDWDMDPLSDEELADFDKEKFDSSFVRKDDPEELTEIAEEYANG